MTPEWMEAETEITLVVPDPFSNIKLMNLLNKISQPASPETRFSTRSQLRLKTFSVHLRDSLRLQPFLPTLLLCFITVFSGSGCRSTSEETSARFFPGGKPAQPEPGELQQSLLQFADAYSSRIIESVDELEDVEGSPFTQEGALLFKISTVGSVITIATGENPNINLLNLMSLSTLSRMILENHWVTKPNGSLFELWLGRSQALERKIWRIAEKVLTKEQQDELRHSLENHYATLTNLDSLFLTHPHDLIVPKNLTKQGNDKSVFSLAALNPFSGLDPTVREIAQTRLFAERALFTLQWTPWLLRWQSELLILQTTSQPEIVQAFGDITSLSESVDRVSKAAESIGMTAAALPAQLADERKAIVEALDAQEGQITTLFEAGTDLSVSLNTTIASLDALMKRFGVGEPRTNSASRDPNKRPFDILDYAKTAESFTAMAEQLNTTITELNAMLDSPALENVSPFGRTFSSTV